MSTEDKDYLDGLMDKHQPAIDDKQYDWVSMAPGIMEGVAKRKRRRRPLWWILTGIGIVLAALVSYPLLVTEPTGNDYKGMIDVGSSVVDPLFPATVTTSTAVPIDVADDSYVTATDRDHTGGNELKHTGSAVAKSAGGYQTTDVGLYAEVRDSGAATSLTSTSLNTAPTLAIRSAGPANTGSATASDSDGGGLGSVTATTVNTIDRLPVVRVPALVSHQDRYIDYADSLTYLDDLKVIDERLPKNYLRIATGVTYTLGATPFYQSTPRTDMMIDMRYQRAVSSRIYVAGGVQATRFSHKASFVERSTVMLYRPGTVDTVYTLRGQVVENSTTDSIPGIRTRTFRNYNRLTQVALPVIVGYQYLYDRLEWYAGLGIVTVINSTISGRLIDGDGILADADGLSYRRSGRIHPMMEASVAYRLFDECAVVIGVQYQRQGRGAGSGLWSADAMSTGSMYLGVRYAW